MRFALMRKIQRACRSAHRFTFTHKNTTSTSEVEDLRTEAPYLHSEKLRPLIRQFQRKVTDLYHSTLAIETLGYKMLIFESLG